MSPLPVTSSSQQQRAGIVQGVFCLGRGALVLTEASLRVQLPKYKVSFQNHDYSSQCTNPRYPEFEDFAAFGIGQDPAFEGLSSGEAARLMADPAST